jgi:tripartite ATP-independent transporter DctM subunit
MPSKKPARKAKAAARKVPEGSGIALEGHLSEATVEPAFWHPAENLLLTFFFGVMMILPLIDIVGRKLHILFPFLSASLIPGSMTLVQHATLAIMMFGGAVAAREGKLLQLATTASLIPDRFRAATHILTIGLGAAITLYLVKAGYSYSMIEKGVGSIIAIGIPKWTVLFLLPLGFSIILCRMIWRSSDKMLFRLITAAVAIGLAYWAPTIQNPPDSFIYACFGILMVAVVLGMPVFLVLGGAALIFLWNSTTPIDSIPAETYRMVVSPTIPTIPLFTLTGYFLAEGGASQRLLRVFQALFGWMRGGPAIVTALVCAFFTAFTGGSGVTILALGGLLMPILIAEKYKNRDALGLLTSAGSLGMLFPPSLPVILYGVVSHTSILDLFAGGLVPGFLLLGLTAWWGIAKSSKQQAARHPFHRQEALDSAWLAKWELALPFVVFFFLFIIKVTLVESAALTALYAFIVEVFIYGNFGRKKTAGVVSLDIKDVPKVVTECGILVGGVLLILGVSLGFTNDMVDAQVPARLAAWVHDSVHSQWIFLIMVNLMLIVVGSLLEIFAAIVVVVPLLMPMSAAFGVDPVHMGIIFLANMELGFIAPPLGLNLFLSSYRFKKSMWEVYVAVWPMYLILHAMVLLITFWPSLTTALPQGNLLGVLADLAILSVLVAEIMAVINILQGKFSRPFKTLWVLFVLCVPIVGLIFWYSTGRRK